MGKIKRSSAAAKMCHVPMAFCLLLALSRPVLIMAQVTLPATNSPVPTLLSTSVSTFGCFVFGSYVYLQ
eukprot:scaffold34579_cov112-Skeletonema_dohrnii-CCMP3373.AAC.2